MISQRDHLAATAKSSCDRDDHNDCHGDYHSSEMCGYCVQLSLRSWVSIVYAASY